MAIQTQNLGLKKPEKTDFYNVDDFNGNMDIVDEEVNKLKPNVIINGVEEEKIWKHKTVVITDFVMPYSEGPNQYYGSINVNELLSDEEISDVLVTGIIGERASFQTGTSYDYEIFLNYVAYIHVIEVPFWEISIRSDKTHQGEEMQIPRLIIDIIYK